MQFLCCCLWFGLVIMETSARKYFCVGISMFSRIFFKFSFYWNQMKGKIIQWSLLPMYLCTCVTCSLRFWSGWRCRGEVILGGGPSRQCYCSHSDSHDCSETQRKRERHIASVKINCFKRPNTKICKTMLPFNTINRGKQYHLSFRWELLALCRGLEVMLLLPVMLLVLVTMGEPELWARLWIIVWASSASSTTSLISCSCWSLVLLLDAAAGEENEDCTAPPTAQAEPGDDGQNNVFQNCKTEFSAEF